MRMRTTLLGLALIGGATAAVWAEQAPVAAPPSRLAAGYLGPDRLPDSIALLPPPPAPRSRALRLDHDGERRALALRGTARWDLAAGDANIFRPDAASTMSCAAGLAIGPDTTPRLNALLRGVMPDLGRASLTAKNKYNRPRPFVGNGRPTCTPAEEAALRTNGSYPSGHSTIGYGWGLILGDLLPGRKAELLRRGRAFGDSRRVCNVHFRSDIEAGQALAPFVIARLQGDPAYRADFAAARAELRSVTRVKPQCAAERAALRLR